MSYTISRGYKGYPDEAETYLVSEICPTKCQGFRIGILLAHCPTLESAVAALRLFSPEAYWDYLECESNSIVGYTFGEKLY